MLLQFNSIYSFLNIYLIYYISGKLKLQVSDQEAVMLYIVYACCTWNVNVLANLCFSTGLIAMHSHTEAKWISVSLIECIMYTELAISQIYILRVSQKLWRSAKSLLLTHPNDVNLTDNQCNINDKLSLSLDLILCERF